jgi:methylamine utilization protein MauE
VADDSRETRPQGALARGDSLRRAGGHLGRLLLGLIFLAAGILKGLDPLEFAHQVAGYGIAGGRLAALGAPALIVFEIMLGVTLIAGIRPVVTGLVSVLLLLAFIGIEAYGLLAGRTESCGCFGAYVQRTPAEVIGEDLVFVGLGILLLWGLKGWSGMRSGRASAVLLAALVVSTTFVVASPSLPIDAYVTRLRVGRSVADLDLAARVPELQQGRHLVALIDVTDPGAPAVASALDALAGQPGAPPVIGLTPSTEQEIDAFRWTSVPTFEIHRIDRDVIKRLYRKLPRFFVVDSGAVSAIFDGAPPERQDLLSWKS